MKKLIGAALLVAALSLSGCATMGNRGNEVSLRPNQRTPAAEGSIALSNDKNGNTVAEVKMKHLPPPPLLSPELATYVVWARAAGQDQYQNVGQVRLDADREANTFVRVPYSSFDLLITAEPVPSAREPSEYRVLEGSVGGAPVRDGEPTTNTRPAAPERAPTPRSTPIDSSNTQTPSSEVPLSEP
jgi:predicted small secreted protein